jgi:hypothetical protein
MKKMTIAAGLALSLGFAGIGTTLISLHPAYAGCDTCNNKGDQQNDYDPITDGGFGNATGDYHNGNSRSAYGDLQNSDSDTRGKHMGDLNN